MLVIAKVRRVDNIFVVEILSKAFADKGRPRKAAHRSSRSAKRTSLPGAELLGGICILLFW